MSQNPLNADENTISVVLDPVAIEAESKKPPAFIAADPVVTVEYPVEAANDDITKLASVFKEAVKFADDGGDELYNLNTIFSPTVKLVVGTFRLKVYDSVVAIYFNIGL